MSSDPESEEPGNVRRKTSPGMIQKLWSAITYIRHQRQVANKERIMRYMQRSFETTQSIAKSQLMNAVEDGLIERYTYVGSKGTKSGTEQEGFKIPEGASFERGTHDWYCSGCHTTGEVIECKDCWRVYHPACIEEAEDPFICPYCKDLEEVKRNPRIKRKELNRLLAYTIAHLREKARELYKLFVSKDDVRYRRFIYQPMDLARMETKATNRKYRYMEQFLADAETVLHNISVCYGGGDMINLAKVMIGDCKYDLEEIRQCKDCYHYSNAKPKDWFCEPCRPAHELVYAKQKGFSFWPAKVIKVTNDNYDVRFFGGFHQRAVVPKSSIRPIDTNPRQLNIKKAAAGFNKACDELKRHQNMLAQFEEAEASSGKAEDEGEEEEEEMEEEEEEEVVEEIEEFVEEELEPPKPKRSRASKGAEAEAISSSHSYTEKSAPTPEDANLVTSTEDNVQNPRVISSVDTGTQTSKKLSHGGKNRGSQTDKGLCGCKCEGKMHGSEQEIKKEIKKELKKEVKKDAESPGSQRDVERIRKQVDERYQDEAKKLKDKHKLEISQTKKKQWCYNCEEEAMYHCCWNTSYCSIKCQQEHWHREHKRCCRRKR